MIREVIKNVKELTKHLDFYMEEHFKEYDLTAQQVRVLGYIFLNEGAYQKEIENKFLLSNATVTGIISRLEKKGYVVRIPMQDRRYNRIVATANAVKLKDYINSVIQKTDSILEAGIDKADLEITLMTLVKILKNLEGNNNG